MTSLLIANLYFPNLPIFEAIGRSFYVLLKLFENDIKKYVRAFSMRENILLSQRSIGHHVPAQCASQSRAAGGSAAAKRHRHAAHPPTVVCRCMVVATMKRPCKKRTTMYYCFGRPADCIWHINRPTE